MVECKVKAGDSVLVPRRVKYSWNSSKVFLVRAVVDRETKTQLVIGDRRFKKENLCEIGKYFSIIETDLSKDESDKCTAFVSKVRMCQSMALIDGIGRIDYNAPLEKIERAKVLYDELCSIISEAQND